MYKILIDSSERYEKSVKLFKGESEVDSMVGDLDLTVAIREILKKNKLDIKEIEVFDANPGPGSFTGLKIGLTIVNILNWALGKKKSTDLTYPKYGSEPNIHNTKWLE